jgi:hypothetical protein
MNDVVDLIAAGDHEAELKSLVTDILSRAKQCGADAAEVSASEDAGLGVTVRLGELESVEFNRDRGFGITVYCGKRKGSASTSDSTPEAVAATGAPVELHSQACPVFVEHVEVRMVELQLVVTGIHLSAAHGMTVREIEVLKRVAAGLFR